MIDATPSDSGSTFENTALLLGELFLHEAHRFAASHRLDVVHLRALTFLQRANKYSDTSVALIDYLGLTKGTVSQSIKLLAQRGFLVKLPDLADRRCIHLKVTPVGRQIVDGFLEHVRFSRVREVLTDEQMTAGNASLTTILRASQQVNGLRTFGLCHTCRHFQARDGGGVCQLTSETLVSHEIVQRCREHEYPA